MKLMSLERPNKLEFKPDPPISEMTGEEYESAVAYVLEVGWDKYDYLAAREKEDDERVAPHTFTDPVLKKWFDRWSEDKRLPSFTEWRRLPAAEQRRSLLEWAASKQQADWRPESALTEIEPDPELQPGYHLPPEEAIDLEMTITAGSPADVLYGADGYFKFEGRVVTYDLTANEEKEKQGVKLNKADEVIRCELKDLDCWRQAGQRIARVFDFQAEQEAARRPARQGPTEADVRERERRLKQGVKARRVA